MVKKYLLVILSGIIFGIGLAISGMANPYKVLNFLDLAGSWDPSLLFVMGAGLLVTTVGFKLINSFYAKPMYEPSFSSPTQGHINAKLVIGSIIFGIGWGYTGICPGPAIANTIGLTFQVFLFLVSMFCSGALVQMVLTKN